MKKLKSLFRSRRFWAGAGGIGTAIGSLIHPELESILTEVIALASVWIVGDSVRKTQ